MTRIKIFVSDPRYPRGSAARLLPKCKTFQLVDEIFDRTGDVFDGDIRVDAMLVEKVDALRAQTFEGFVSHVFDVIGPGVEPSFPGYRNAKKGMLTGF